MYRKESLIHLSPLLPLHLANDFVTGRFASVPVASFQKK